MSDGNTAALRRYAMHDRADVLPAGEERCAHCGEPHEEGDLYRLGGDGDWMCEACIVGCSQMYSRTRGYAIMTATALQVIGGENCKAMADEALTFLEGR